GRVSWELGLQEEALAAYRRSLALGGQTAAAAPGDPDVRASLGMGHARVGFTLRTMGRPPRAPEPHAQGRGVQGRAPRDHPSNARYQEVLSWTLNNLGVIHQGLGHPAEAIRLQRRAIAIFEDLVRRVPANTRHRSDLGWSWRYLGLALAASGDLEAALG